MSATGIIQAATTIAKTTQTAMGSEIGTENAEYITLFFTYTKGQETGLDIILNARRTTGGTNHPNAAWSTTAGVSTFVAEKIRLSATGDYYFTWYIEGIDFILFTQGGSHNNGTTLGTLAASYTLSS
jgi:hypothetical protein